MSGNLSFRKALPQDKAAVLAICAQVWEGDDYIPYVWDTWLADPIGQLTVAVLDDQVVGLGKLTRLARGEWWLEGLRVDPAHRQRGIGRHLHEYQVALADEIAGGMLRFATSSANTSVHHFAARTGFTRVGNYSFYEAQPASDPAAVAAFTPLSTADVSQAERFLAASERLQAAHGLFEKLWAWQTLTRAKLAEYARRGRLLAWRDLSGLVLIMPRRLGDEEPHLRVAFADAPGERLADLARDLRALAAQRGAAKVDWKALARPDILAALEAAGYECTWENTLWVLERPIKRNGQ